MTNAVAKHPTRRRASRIVIAAFALVVAAWAAFGAKLVLFPSTDDPREADAIVVLGPVVDWRVDAAYELVDEGIADTVTFTLYEADEDEPYCSARRPGVEVLCFYPDPYTTQGEATWVNQQAEARGWDRVVVITANPHIDRARWIFHDCIGGDVETLFPAQAKPDHSINNVLYQFAYQTFAFAKAVFVTPGCADSHGDS